MVQSQLVDQFGNQIKKVITQQSNEFGYSPRKLEGKRGITVYTTSQLQQITGRDKQGRLLSWGLEQPYFYLTVDQRIEIFRLSSPVFGVVTSRMQRISGLDFSIISEKKKEEEIVGQMKDLNTIYNEYKDSTDLGHLTLRAKIYQNLIPQLPDLKPDLSNFNGALLRWKRRLKIKNSQSCDSIYNWLMEPNNGIPWESFVKKWVLDYMIHGSAAIYKGSEDNRLKNFDVLPGGSVYPIKAPYFSGVEGYVQILPGFAGYTPYAEPQIYFSDEMVYSQYIPTSSRNYGMIPLEALINKIAESLFFDQLMAEQADGTGIPEKMIIVTDNSPFGSLDANDKGDIPIDIDEQKRIQEKVNTPIKGKIMTFSGNSAEVIDLSRENTMEFQNKRQKDIREEVALVFNMSNMEINLTGSGDTSGRNTSEAQAEIEQGKGIAPIAKSLATAINKGLIPYKFGSGFVFEFNKGKSDKEEKELDLLTLQTGENTKNDIREKYNKDSFGEEYDKPEGGGSGSVPGDNQFNPMYTTSIDNGKFGRSKNI